MTIHYRLCCRSSRCLLIGHREVVRSGLVFFRFPGLGSCRARGRQEEALDWKRARLAKNEKALASLKLDESRLEEELAKLKEDLDLCLKEDSDDLARKTIARKLHAERQLSHLGERVRKLDGVCEEQRRELDFQQGQLESIAERAKLFVRTERDDSAFSVAESMLTAADQRGKGARRRVPEVGDDEVELELMRLKESYHQGGVS